MRRQAIGLAVLAVALATPAWADDKPAADDEKLIGTWTLSSLEVQGKPLPLPEGENTFTFAKGGKTSMKQGGKAVNGSYKPGPVKTPREIDLAINPSGEGSKMETSKAIYQIEGDTLKIAIPEGATGARPMAFDSNKAGILTFKRQKP